MTKNTVLFILLILIGAIVYYFFQSGIISIYDHCKEYRKIYDLKFKGIVVEKVDVRQNFRSRHLLVKNDAEASQIELELLFDSNIDKGSFKSQFWELVNVGDSVSKNNGTFFVSYKKADSDWIRMYLGFTLCPD